MTKPGDLVTIDDSYEGLKKYIYMFTRYARRNIIEAKQRHQDYADSDKYNEFQVALNHTTITDAQNDLRLSINAAIINYYFDLLMEKGKDD